MESDLSKDCAGFLGCYASANSLIYYSYDFESSYLAQTCPDRDDTVAFPTFSFPSSKFLFHLELWYSEDSIDSLHVNNFSLPLLPFSSLESVLPVSLCIGFFFPLLSFFSHTPHAEIVAFAPISNSECETLSTCPFLHMAKHTTPYYAPVSPSTFCNTK